MKRIWFGFTSHQSRVLSRLKSCRTTALGVMHYRCSNPSCKHIERRYISCKNRSCSICSWLPREKWKLQRCNDVIPDTKYYHYVFTLPHALSQLAAQNQVAVQTLLFRSISSTLKSFSLTHCRGGKIGFMQVLHTWSTRLNNHYHIHVVVPGGYLLNDTWHSMDRYMFPARGLVKVFRSRFCQGLRRLNDRGELHFQGNLSHLTDRSSFGLYIDESYRRNWHVHAEVTRGSSPDRLIGYLSNYVYKTAIDHSRIKAVTEDYVEFDYRSHDDSDRGTFKSMRLSPEEFLRRFTGHIQPKKFVRIRYYGILGGGVKRKYLSSIFHQKSSDYKAVNQEIHLSSCEKIISLSDRFELPRCPVCGSEMISPWRHGYGTGPPEVIEKSTSIAVGA